jgi:predicted metal-dependent phosphoesterase TrpH
LIDLHTHTTASDGRLEPSQLVARAAAAGVTVLAVTDHDTIGGCEAAAAACAASGITFVPGIEITAVMAGADVHVLGYFFDIHSRPLLDFLAEQRLARIERVRQMVARLAKLGLTLNADAIVQPAIDDPRKSAGRPWIARALVRSGQALSTDDAFERWLGRGRAAFVPRLGAAPEEVFERVHDAGGIASLAHPGLAAHDERIDGFVASGLDAIEAYHSRHDGATTVRYISLAARAGIAVSGGSDFHGDPSHGPDAPGAVTLPREEYEELVRLKPDTAGERTIPRT